MRLFPWPNISFGDRERTAILAPPFDLRIERLAIVRGAVSLQPAIDGRAEVFARVNASVRLGTRADGRTESQ